MTEHRLTLSETYAALRRVGGDDPDAGERAANALAHYIENIDQRLATMEEARLAKDRSDG